MEVSTLVSRDFSHLPHLDCIWSYSYCSFFGFNVILWKFPDDLRFDQSKTQYGYKCLLFMNIDTGCQGCESSTSEVSALTSAITSMKKEFELGSISSASLDSLWGVSLHDSGKTESCEMKCVTCKNIDNWAFFCNLPNINQSRCSKLYIC